MKYLLIILLLLTNSIFAQTSISTAINNGNSKELSSYFNSTVDMTVPEANGSYSKSQSEMIIKDFFKKYKPILFKINQEGSYNNSLFTIGILYTKKGNFRTYYMLRKIDNKYLIHQLQFEIN